MDVCGASMWRLGTEMKVSAYAADGHASPTSARMNARFRPVQFCAATVVHHTRPSSAGR
jgi:hypothetical protein